MSYNAYTEYGEITKEQVNRWKEQRVIAAARALIATDWPSTGNVLQPIYPTVPRASLADVLNRWYELRDALASLDTLTD